MSVALQPGKIERPSFRDVAELNGRFAHSSAEEVLAWGAESYGSRLAIACSFSVEDIVLIDAAVRVDSEVRVFTLDTGRWHQETYDAMAAVRDFFGIEVEVLFPKGGAVEDLVRRKGPNSFYESIENRKECCKIRKVEPLRRVLQSADAWATGMRRGQSTTRSELQKVEMDMLNGGLLKLNPLADWTSEDVWRVVADRGLPYNRLHDSGYPSIGCAPCTRAVSEGGDERSGRWWWERPDDRECGLHK